MSGFIYSAEPRLIIGFQYPPGGLKTKESAVLGAVFSLGNYLDLTDKKSLDIVNEIYRIYSATMDAKGLRMPTNDNPAQDSDSLDNVIRRLDCVRRRESKLLGAPLPPPAPKRGLTSKNY